jgi:hypothetical protein
VISFSSASVSSLMLTSLTSVRGMSGILSGTPVQYLTHVSFMTCAACMRLHTCLAFTGGVPQNVSGGHQSFSTTELLKACCTVSASEAEPFNGPSCALAFAA